MPERLHFTDSDAANELIARDPLALLIGFVLDQQVTVQKAFSGPARHPGARSARWRPSASPPPTSRPCSASGPPSTASRARWRGACTTSPRTSPSATAATPPACGPTRTTPEELRANLEALPGFGKMKVDSTAAVLARRFGVELAEPLVPDHPTLGDVDSPEALAEYQAGKRAAKAATRAQGAARR